MVRRSLSVAGSESFFDEKAARDVFLEGLVAEFGQGQRPARRFALGQLLEQVINQIQATAFLVVEIDHVPGCVVGVGRAQHGVAPFAIGGVLLARFDVNWRQLPALGGIFRPFGEAFFLFFLVDAEPVLEQDQAVIGDQAFEHRAVLQELLVLGGCAEAHDRFDAGAVVPAAIEEDKFTGTRQLARVALEVPLAALAFIGFRKRDGAHVAIVERRLDGLDHTALAGCIAPLEDNGHALVVGNDPVLQVDQLGV